MHLSSHAIERSNQRGIPEAMIDLIIKFGAVEYHRGSEIFSLDKKGLRKAKSYFGSLYSGSRDTLRDFYIVVREDTVVTAARRTTHHKRQRH